MVYTIPERKLDNLTLLIIIHGLGDGVQELMAD